MRRAFSFTRFGSRSRNERWGGKSGELPFSAKAEWTVLPLEWNRESAWSSLLPLPRASRSDVWTVCRITIRSGARGSENGSC